MCRSLARSLDENLHTRYGPVRTFLILARYCSRTVFEEQKELIAHRHGGSGSLVWPPSNLVRLAAAWVQYMRVEWKLTLYECWIATRRALGMAPLLT